MLRGCVAKRQCACVRGDVLRRSRNSDWDIRHERKAVDEFQDEHIKRHQNKQPRSAY